MATLYEIDRQIEQVIETGFVYDDETGEVLMDGSCLDDLQVAFEDKLNACGMWLKNRRALRDAIKAEEAKLKRRREVIEKETDRMEAYVSRYLYRMKDRKFETPECRMSLRRSKRVVVDDESRLAKDYKLFTITERPDKKAIKEAIDSGILVDGARVEEHESLQLR